MHVTKQERMRFLSLCKFGGKSAQTKNVFTGNPTRFSNTEIYLFSLSSPLHAGINMAQGKCAECYTQPELVHSKVRTKVHTVVNGVWSFNIFRVRLDERRFNFRALGTSVVVLYCLV